MATKNFTMSCAVLTGNVAILAAHWLNGHLPRPYGIHLHLEEEVAGVSGANPRRINKVCLAPNAINPHIAVGIEVGRQRENILRILQ